MKKNSGGKRGVGSFTVMPFLLPLLLLSSVAVPAEKIRVVTTTSLIGSIVERIGGNKVVVTTIVPAGMCPGHFDLKPGQMRDLYTARVVIIHGWEKWMKKMLESPRKPLPIRTVAIEGNWMVPDVQIAAAREITKILSEIDPWQRGWYKENLKNYLREIQVFSRKVEKLKEGWGKIKIICASQQEEFLKWLGLEVVAVYGRSEELNPKEIIAIIEKARKKEVGMVVDNLQSGADTGLEIAREVGAKHITLTNFPLNGSYLDSLKENINKISQSLGCQKL